jgi:hypothetical protein
LCWIVGRFQQGKFVLSIVDAIEQPIVIARGKRQVNGVQARREHQEAHKDQTTNQHSLK